MCDVGFFSKFLFSVERKDPTGHWPMQRKRADHLGLLIRECGLISYGLTLCLHGYDHEKTRGIVG
jgi:hypothetical protein